MIHLKITYKKSLIPLLISLSATLPACTDPKSSSLEENYVTISADAKPMGSSTAGNLITTAIQRVHKLNMVFYPSGLLDSENFALLNKNLATESFDMEQLLALYPGGAQDVFSVGTMTGDDIKEFVLGRIGEKFEAELQVAGLKYDIRYLGGIPTIVNIIRDNGEPIEDDTSYSVAISEFYFFSGYTFPSYKYRNGLGSRLRRENWQISARDTLQEYVSSTRYLPPLQEPRAHVEVAHLGDAGMLKISGIQGHQHLSPYYAQSVITEGIVTAIGLDDWYPGGTDIVIQDPEPDDDPRTSEAILAHLPDEETNYKVGDKIRVQGIVSEVMTGTGLSATTIREISKIDLIASQQALPAPILLDQEHLKIPMQFVSTFRGDLNQELSLNLLDGIDFWESLEWMRVQMRDLRVLGFRGGNVKAEDLDPKRYLSLYVTPNEFIDKDTESPHGGLLLDSNKLDYNPEIISMSTSHLASGINQTLLYNVGDTLNGSFVGIIAYLKNIFGDGEYSFILSGEESSTLSNTDESDVVPLAQRPVTDLVSSENSLTIGTFNVENLPSSQPERILSLAQAISTNLKCPDILNLVEIQDSNGANFFDGSSGEKTLDSLILKINCSPTVNYKYLNINPLANTEGGQPGGNIRVAMLYNTDRVGFEQTGVTGPLVETVIQADGSLSTNPGRVFPNDQAFSQSRKSLVAQFTFKGRRITLIGNHFNSKLGDTSRWSNIQPPLQGSEVRRSAMADRINNFVTMLEKRDPNAYIVVLGDFNSYFVENPMLVLEGRNMKNLINYGTLLPENERYTANYNGSSQSLDYIFANLKLLEQKPELNIVHINTDYMGRISDHDPVVSRFTFE